MRHRIVPHDKKAIVPFLVFIGLTCITLPAGLLIGLLIVHGGHLPEAEGTQDRIARVCRQSYQALGDGAVQDCMYQQTVRVLTQRMDDRSAAAARAVGN